MSDNEPDEALRLDLCTVPCSYDAECEKFDSDQGKFVCVPDGNGPGRCASPDAYRGARCFDDADCTRDEGTSCVFSSKPTSAADQGTCSRLCPAAPGRARRAAASATSACRSPSSRDGTSKPGCYPGYFGLPCTADDQCVGDLSAPARPTRRRKICTALCQTDEDCAGQSLDRRQLVLLHRHRSARRRFREDAACQAASWCQSRLLERWVRCAMIRSNRRRARRAAGRPASPARPPARAGEKIAVLVLATADKDADLADNLTEVIIAYAAQHGGFEIAGKEEFRARLGVESERRAQACLDDVSCLGRAGVSLGVRRIVAGSVGTRGKQVPVQPEPRQRPGRQGREPRVPAGRGRRREPHQGRAGGGERAVPSARRAGEDPGLVRSRGARVAIDNAYLGVTPLISPTLVAGQTQRPRRGHRSLPVDLARGGPPGRGAADPADPRQPAAPAALARERRVRVSTALAAGAFAAGAFLGVLSQLQPNGDSRQAAMQDLDQKRDFARGPTSRSAPAPLLGGDRRSTTSSATATTSSDVPNDTKIPLRISPGLLAASGRRWAEMVTDPV